MGLRSSIMHANDRFGGHLGTKLIHIVNRYSISNETGRDIKIAANAGSGSNLIVSATTSPQPFHFDDSRSIMFRFIEFGWAWSGLFRIRLNRREVTMRLRHKMKVSLWMSQNHIVEHSLSRRPMISQGILCLEDSRLTKLLLGLCSSWTVTYLLLK